MAVFMSGCSKQPASKLQQTDSSDASGRFALREARAAHDTKLVRHESGLSVPPEIPPPSEQLVLTKYQSAVGPLSAYVTSDPGDGLQHPAIVWLTGGDVNSIADVWTPMPPSNDQSASVYRDRGIVMMYPSLRGGNDNPGQREGFLGEVEDVISASDKLAALSYVDPQRIYLGGHSTGGTLALLVAESTDRFRAVFSVGPVADPRDYGGSFVYHDVKDEQESRLRAPLFWLDEIRVPTFVIEGSEQGNIYALHRLDAETDNPHLRFLPVYGGTHFDILAPVNSIVAEKITADSGPECSLNMTPNEVAKAKLGL